MIGPPLDPLAAAAFEALLERTGHDVLILCDPRLRIVRAGPGAAELAARPRAELPGMSLIAAFGSASLDGITRRALSGEHSGGEARLGQVGARSYRVEAVPIAGGHVVVSLHDVTALRRIERIRRDFVANISHELRTPLSSIKLLAETLTSEATDDPATAREFAEQIAREVDHLSQLVDELLELSTIESGEARLTIEALDPDAVVSSLADRIGPVAARRSISVRLAEPGRDEDPSPIRAAADPARLGQALLNLAHNAVKYSHPGSEVRLGWEARPKAVRFTVADDGIGIAQAHQARIFERFYRVDRARTRAGEIDDEQAGRTSAGLGLAIVRHIAEAHGGRAGLRSREGSGSTFWVEVPRAG